MNPLRACPGGFLTASYRSVMASPAPIYSNLNCKPAYQLNWSISLFGRASLPGPSAWSDALRVVLESDGIHVLETTSRGSQVFQFFVSTQPSTAPTDILRLLKGRLQYLIRDQCPSAFRRNYRLESVGSARADVVEKYLAGQLRRQGMADPRAQARLVTFQIDNHAVDLSSIRYSSHGQFIYNLHVVLVHADRGIRADEQSLRQTRDMVLKVVGKNALTISWGAILGDHLHLTLGCDLKQSPEEIALSLLNNIAFAHGMVPWFEFGYYVGTFGPYDRGAIRHALAGSQSSTGASPVGNGLSYGDG